MKSTDENVMSTTTSTSTVTSLLPGGDPFAVRPKVSSTTSGETKDMFMKLLVEQIKHQDPLNPSDGLQFVTQLAQFTQLEQTLSMSANLAAIRQDLEQSTSTAGTGGAA
jgi:flagellar hook assembly protein FlgD